MTAAAEVGLERSPGAWRPVLLVGLLFMAVALYVTLVGFVGRFAELDLVQDVVTLGQAVLLLTAIGAGFVGARRAPSGPVNQIVGGAIAGLLAGTALSLLILIGPAIGLREYLPNASPDLYDLIAGVEVLGVEGSREMWRGEVFPTTFWYPAAVGLALGALGAVIALLPRRLRMLVVVAAVALIFMGLFAGILRSPMLQHGPTSGIARDLFASSGLRVPGALLVLGLVLLIYLMWVVAKPRERYRALPERTRKHPAVVLPLGGLLLLVVLLLPLGFTGFVPAVIALIAVYALMGLGLNITLGLAGLLDLGFVAFFAVGAYTVGLLTSTAEFGIAQWPFWAAIPFAVLVAMGFGIFLGLPILGIRGDYLAIATLGFGEIIAILAKSDLLKPYIGGPRGILNIPAPVDLSIADRQMQIYYISLICIVIISFVAVRLRDSRLGRAWIAIREDEDVAEALGVNLVQTKSLAYALGAAFAGLGGAVFAALYGSIISSSISLNVSILVVTIVVIGGMGSIPGAIIGALVIIGLPELFREFAEYRFLLYGIALILIMLWRPEGLLPSKVGRQEMHHDALPMEGEPGAPAVASGSTEAAAGRGGGA